ncbi:glycosyltransferase family 87 protein [Methylobacterium sp. J-076]|uniref:glycosyltransferase family 87 protein n=1 Tax=Methylobacterium sp. J-076 TaxID=2836655 RepID=UPI001FBC03DD|nr:glycosyltransferase family 87 protein [Methylobacterium sp. J-076]MCJ2012987.1 DUF2029 domain-containing protein [Methylobacterium sp. J-076]
MHVTATPAGRDRFGGLRADFADIVLNDARLLAFGRRAALFLVPLVLAIIVVLFGTGPEPRRNWYGDFLGNDFAQVWVAGRAALEGRGAEPYDLARHLANLRDAFGPECRFAWHYPPVFLLPAAAMAWFDPQAGYLVWCALSAALFLLAVRAAAGRMDIAFIAFAHPLVFCNLSYGQNGLFTAGLMTLGLVALDRHPRLAGLCFGLLAYKPQFAALAPLLLIATGRLTALAACAATVLAACLASLALFGVAPWLGFLHSLGETNRIILQNAAAGLDLNASAFGAVRLAGGSTALAWALQITVTLAALAFVWRVWRGGACPEIRAAAFLAAAPLMSPYVPIYDLAPLVPATVFLGLAARKAGGFAGHERVLLAVSPLAALLRVGAGATGFSFGLALALATFGCVAWRAQRVTRPAAAGSGTAA